MTPKAKGAYHGPALVLATLVSSGVAMGTVERHHFGNGTTCIVAPGEGTLAEAQLWLHRGAACDDAAVAGCAHLLEHLLHRRLATGDGRALVTARTFQDAIVVASTIEPDSLGWAIRRLAGLATSIDFAAGEIESEKRVIAAELMMRTEPDRLGDEVSRRLFAGGTYARPVVGSAQSLDRLRRRHLLDFFGRFVRANTSTLVVAGPMEAAPVLEVASDALAGLESGADSAPTLAPGSPRTVSLRSHGRTVFAARGPGAGHEDSTAFEAATWVLRSIARSESWEPMVHFEALRESSVLAVHASSENEPGAIEDFVYRAFERLSERALEQALGQWTLAIARRRETTSGLATRLGKANALGSRGADTQPDLSVAEVKRAAALYLKPGSARPGSSAAVSPAAAPAPAKRPTKPRSGTSSKTRFHILPSGIRLVVHPVPGASMVAVRAGWLGGQLLESEATQGVHQLLAAAITSGCKSRSPRLSRRLESAGGGLRGAVGRNTFAVSGQWLAGAWKDGLDLVANCVLSPSLDGAQVHALKPGILDSIDALASDALAAAHRVMLQALFAGHPYRLSLRGRAQPVRALSAKDLEAWYGGNYPPGQLVLAVAGGVEPDEVLAWAEKRFSKTPKANRTLAARPGPQAVSGSELFVETRGDDASIAIGFRTPALAKSIDHLALVAIAALLERPGGRLYRRLRNDNGLAYHFGATSVDGLDGGYFTIYATIAPERAGEAIAVIREEIARLATEGVGPGELEAVVRTLELGYLHDLQRTSALAGSLLLHELYGGGYRRVFDYSQRLRGLTPNDLKRVASARLAWGLATSVTASPRAMSPQAARRARGIRKRPRRAPSRRSRR